MHLLAPWWGLLLIPLAGGLILLYLLKLRRRDFLVSSVFLWEQALQDLQANAPLQKLRKNLLLIIQLLVLLFAVLALMRPAMLWTRQGGRSVVLILDASASMQSTDVTPSRFRAAKRRAADAIEALGARDRMMLVAIGGPTRALTPFTTDKRALHLALDALEVTDARADLRSAVELAAGMARGKHAGDKPDVLVLSDGALPAVTLPSGFDLPVHYEKIGRRGENVGIVMMDARRRVSKQGGFEGFLVIKNCGKHAQTFTLDLFINDQQVDSREITLQAGARHTEMLDELPPTGGVLRAKLDIADDLAADNEAQIILPKSDQVPVTLVTSGNLFLRTALALDPTLLVTERATMPASLPPGSVLVADNVPVGQLPPAVPALLIGEVGAAMPGRLKQHVEEPEVVDWERNSPTLAHVDLQNLHIAHASVLFPGTGAHGLIDTRSGPIALSAESQGRRLVYLGWDLHASDFPLRVGFPIFLANSIDWLCARRQRAQAMNVHTGQVVQIPLPPGVNQVTLTAPHARPASLAVTASPLALNRVTRAGLYSVKANGVEIPFAANLLDATESDIAPHDQLALEGPGGAVIAQTTGPVRTEREFWRTLLLIALLLLCAEWWVFHRRIG